MKRTKEEEEKEEVSSCVKNDERRRKKRRKQNKQNKKYHKQAESKDAQEQNTAAKEAPLPSITVEDVGQALESRRGTLSDWLNPGHKLFWPELKQSWKSFSKVERSRLVELNKAKCDAQVEDIQHSFEAEADDHCETCPEAYKDIVKALEALAKKLHKSKADLKIYDPYYCAGGVVRNLKDLGFLSVYNRNEDFYKVQTYPEHDVVVTNPPYSADHVEKLLAFVKQNGKPAFLLMPDYVADKPFFRADASKYAFLVPKKRYVYWTPKGLRPKDKLQGHVSALGVRTSPFVSFWFVFTTASLDQGAVEALYPKGPSSCNFFKSLPKLRAHVKF